MQTAKEPKRGRLRSVSIHPMYDEKGKITGHTVHADHDTTRNGKEDYSYAKPIESPHETVDSAVSKAKEHVCDNMANCGESKPAGKGRSMREALEIK